jgi:hypothetical protein
MPVFLLSTHKQCILSHFINIALLCFPENLIPWWDSNPGLLVPEADMMSNAPRHQGHGFSFMYVYASDIILKITVGDPKFWATFSTIKVRF